MQGDIAAEKPFAKRESRAEPANKLKTRRGGRAKHVAIIMPYGKGGII